MTTMSTFRSMSIFFVCAVGLMGAAALGVAVAGDVEQVVVLDECDPATFNAVLGLGACVNVGGRVTFTEFLAALPTGHPAWLFQPTTVSIKKKDTVRATNQGGEIHTFTEVAAFGGGFIPQLNNPPNAAPVPECAGGFANPAVASTRLIQGSSRDLNHLKKGVHRIQCCIHPWMRTEIEVQEGD